MNQTFTLSEKKTESMLKKHPPFGYLADRHPQMNHAVLVKVGEVCYAVSMGDWLCMGPGTRFKRFGSDKVEVL